MLSLRACDNSPDAAAHLVAVAALLVGQHAGPAVRLADLLLARRRLPPRAHAPPASTKRFNAQISFIT